MKLAAGAVFAGDYEVVRELSEGGMGAVYVVLQRSTGKQRALKLMHPQLVADPTLRKRFEQEARVAAMIESDHVVEVVGAGIDEATGSPWLAMELLKGTEVGAIAPAPLAAVHTVLRELCHAVGAAHRARIVHRDLKPENIFLAESKRAGETRSVKVLDFGIAKIAAEASTKHTAAMGSPIWMAPEQTEKSAIGPPTDVWALGLIVYHLLTDHFFWPAADDPNGSVAQVMREVLFTPIPSATTRAAEQGVAQLVPPWFDAWFARCVVRDSTQRFADADAAFAAFDAAVTGRSTTFAAPLPSHPPVASYPPLASRPPTTSAPFATPAATAYEQPRRASRAPLLVAVGVLALLGGGGALTRKLGYLKRPTVVAVASPAPPAPSSDPDPQPEPFEETTPAAPLPSGSTHPSSTKRRSSHPPSGLSSAIAEAVSSTPPSAPEGAPFDRAAAQVLVDAVRLDGCGQPSDAVHGPGKVSVIFLRTGVAIRAFHEPGPYPGTSTALCINQLMLRTRVAPFAGPPQTVTRDFTLRESRTH